MPKQNKFDLQQLRETLDPWIERSKRYAGKVLSLPNDSFEKTMMVALAICLACAVVVSASAVALKPLQVKNKSLDMKKNILDVVGLLEEGGNVHDAFEQFEVRIVDLDTGEYVDTIDVETFDQRKAAKDPTLSVAIERKQDIAGIKRREKYAKVYLLKEGEAIKAIILPVHGYGLWSTMYGFLALEGDGETVIGINFYDQAETPGLGGEVVNPKWRALWQGKKVYDPSGEPRLGLIKGNVDPSKPGAEYQVDGLAGATLTSVGVTNLVRYWMGRQGYALYLEKIRSKKG